MLQENTTLQNVHYEYEQLMGLMTISALNLSHKYLTMKMDKVQEIQSTLRDHTNDTPEMQQLCDNLVRVASHLRMSYVHAMQNNWSECDYQHSAALIHLETFKLYYQKVAGLVRAY